ncbi:MAG: ABC transporter ATP-binding protein [Elusimicrobia bacterium]|nr:ABC transporter ATP-binding protein [Elusimicrobiota bacterium]
MNVYARFLPYLKPYRVRFFQACLAMGGVAIFNGASIYVLKPIVNHLFVSREFQVLWLAVVGIPLLVAMKTVASYIQNYLMSWIGQRVTQEVREELFRHLHALDAQFFSQHKSGEILARVTNDLNTVQSTLNFIPLYLIRDSLTVVVLTAVLFHLNWRFALLALLAIPVASTILSVLGRKMRESSLQSQAIMGHLYSRFQESLQGMMVIKAFNYEEGAIEKFQEENLSFFNQMMRYLRATALSGPLMEFGGSLILALLIYYGGREIIGGRMTPGDFFAFLGAFFAAYAPVKNLARLNSELQRGMASGERIFQLLDQKPLILSASGAPAFSGLQKAVRVEGAWFCYPGRERPALKGVDLAIGKGEVVAVVGPSGSGKSTLVQLLLRLYDPERGRILYDDRDLRDWNLHSVRDQIGLVTQETVLFNDTVFQNVALGRPVVTLAQVEEACRVADAAGFIAQLPQEYQTSLGDRGAKLSGGQRQRLAIARAILKNPSFLILDEATSSLDSASEDAIQKALETLMAGRTVLLIAHRLSTIAMAQRICVLHQGEIVEEGTHRELLSQSGLYHRLYDIQKTQPSLPQPRPEHAPGH